MKAIIAIPSEPVRKAGGKILHFNSGTECATFFQVSKSAVSQLLKKDLKSKPFCGYYFDYEVLENEY